MNRTGLLGRMAAVGLALCANAAFAQANPPVTLKVALPSVRLIEGIVVDVDAAPLRASSNLRLVVMPAAFPDTMANAQFLGLYGTPITPARVHLTLPGGPAGQDEVRLYHIPPFGTTFEVAARAPVTVLPGVPGALLLSELSIFAKSLGPVKFEAEYRGKTVRVQAQFLEAKPESEWQVQWLSGVPAGATARQVAVVALGTRGVPHGAAGSGEALCILRVDAGPALDRIAALSPGDAVLVEGSPSTWSSATSSDPMLIKNCKLVD